MISYFLGGFRTPNPPSHAPIYEDLFPIFLNLSLQDERTTGLLNFTDILPLLEFWFQRFSIFNVISNSEIIFFFDFCSALLIPRGFLQRQNQYKNVAQFSRIFLELAFGFDLIKTITALSCTFSKYTRAHRRGQLDLNSALQLIKWQQLKHQAIPWGKKLKSNKKQQRNFSSWRSFGWHRLNISTTILINKHPKPNLIQPDHYGPTSTF